MKLFDDYLKENINFLTAVLALIILVEATFITSLFLPERFEPIKKKVTSSLTKKPVVASLTLTKGATSYKVGDSFEVGVTLDTQGNKTVGTDLVISYDKDKLEVVDAEAAKEGIQIKGGSLYDTVATNKAIKKEGKIYFAAIASPGKPEFSGKGVLATIKFKAVKAGEALVQADHKIGSTIDSNVVTAAQKDILTRVENSLVSIVQ